VAISSNCVHKIYFYWEVEHNDNPPANYAISVTQVSMLLPTFRIGLYIVWYCELALANLFTQV
jgi:hypothetical protein